VALIDGTLASRTPAMRRQLRLFLAALRWLPFLRYLRPLDRLDGRRQDAALRWFQNHPLQLIRGGFWGVRTLVLPVMEFMRRFLQHVLPRGFVKVRYYGFLSPSFGVPADEIRARVELAQGFARKASAPEIEIEPLAPMRCPHCGGELQYRRVTLPRSRVAIGIGRTFPDRGAQVTTHPLGAGP